MIEDPTTVTEIAIRLEMLVLPIEGIMFNLHISNVYF